MPKINKNISSKKQSTKGKRKKSSKTAAPVVNKTNEHPPLKKGSNPLYILTIMGLFTVIIILLNRFYESGEFNIKKAHKKDVSSLKKDIPDNKSLNRIDLKSLDKVDNKDRNNEVIDAVQKKDVKIYFMKFDENSEKMYLSSVLRKVSSKSLLKDTLHELIKGPTLSEKKKGLLTAVPSNLKLRAIHIKNRTAELDFNSAVEQGGSGNILINRIDQIVYTATQFDTIDNIIIKINGKLRKSLGSDGLSINGPLHRRK